MSVLAAVDGSLPAPRSTLSLSFTVLKLTASASPLPVLGIIGGFECRSKAHCVVRKNWWLLTSEAPALEPRRRFSSLISSFRMRLLQLLYTLQSAAVREVKGGGGGG